MSKTCLLSLRGSILPVRLSKYYRKIKELILMSYWILAINVVGLQVNYWIICLKVYKLSLLKI